MTFENYPVHTYPPDEDQPCTCPQCGCRTDVLHFIREDYPAGGGKFGATVEECPDCGYTFVYEVDMTRYEPIPDAFELILEKLIEQRERDAAELYKLPGLTNAVDRVEVLGEVRGLRAALAKYREEGGGIQCQVCQEVVTRCPECGEDL